MMRTDRWRLKQRLEQSYQRALTRLLNKIYKTADSLRPSEIIDNILKIARSKTFSELAYKLASNMVIAIDVENRRTWREAASESMQGAKFYKMLQQSMRGNIDKEMQKQIEANATIIRTLPLDICYKVTNHVKEEALKGRRSSEIAKEIKEMFPEKTMASAKLIARTETSKTSTALTRSRAQERGKNWYIWRSSHDIRVRSSHNHMDGVIINWDNPPAPETLIGKKSEGKYHAGCIYNCRCFCQPVIFLDYVVFPVKVYYGGKIVSMSRKQFEGVM